MADAAHLASAISSHGLKNMYKNYIFDFYGTLVDIHTNEETSVLWKRMADLYRVYGADYSSQQLKTAYHLLCQENEAALQQEQGREFPEIDLTDVFIELLVEAPAHHPVSHQIEDINEWAYDISNTFRILSRTCLHAYPYTVHVLKTLKDRGCRIFILSNAQKSFTIPEMEQCGVLPYVDHVYISSEYQMKKPEKEFLGVLLKKEHLRKEETLMIGNDCSSDIAVAVKNGVHSILLNTAGDTKEKIDRSISAFLGQR